MLSEEHLNAVEEAVKRQVEFVEQNSHRDKLKVSPEEQKSTYALLLMLIEDIRDHQEQHKQMKEALEDIIIDSPYETRAVSIAKRILESLQGSEST